MVMFDKLFRKGWSSSTTELTQWQRWVLNGQWQQVQ